MFCGRRAPDLCCPSPTLDADHHGTCLELDGEDSEEDGDVEVHDDRQDRANAAEDGDIETDEEVRRDREDDGYEGTDNLTVEMFSMYIYS